MTTLSLAIRKGLPDTRPGELELRQVGPRTMAFLLGVNCGCAETLESALNLPRVRAYVTEHNSPLLEAAQ